MARILMVEENAGTRDFYRGVLSQHICESPGGLNFLLRGRGEPVDLVILEIFHLEGPTDAENMKGLKFLQLLRQGVYEQFGVPADVKVIVATAMCSGQVEPFVEELGVSAILEKPFASATLAETVEKVLGGA